MTTASSKDSPANIQSTVATVSNPKAPRPLKPISVLRLPMQLPLITQALTVRRGRALPPPNPTRPVASTSGLATLRGHGTATASDAVLDRGIHRRSRRALRDRPRYRLRGERSPAGPWPVPPEWAAELMSSASSAGPGKRSGATVRPVRT